ncbi:hypothetical protein Btru_064335 [Bulinus truncatus]|nr:hypothetical protein Btru_064335 [Bulinus truncatus]
MCTLGILQQLTSQRHLFSQQAINTSLLFACRKGHDVLVHALLSAGAQVDTRDVNGNTPLLIAIQNSHINIVRLVLSHGPDLTAANVSGDTALIMSVYANASVILIRLLLSKSSINIDHVNVRGYSALCCAIENFNLEAMKMLIDANANFTTDSSNTPTACNFQATNVYSVGARNELLTLLTLFKTHKENGQVEIAQAALQRDLKTLQLLSSMDVCVLKYSSKTYIDTLISLLKTINSTHLTPNELTIARIFINKYVSLHNGIRDQQMEETTLDLAIKIGHPVLIQYLCQNKFLVTNKLLGNVAENGNSFMLNALLNYEVEINQIDLSGQPQYQDSAVYRALQNEQLECANILLQRGAHLNIDIALNSAVHSKQVKNLKYLFHKYNKETREYLVSSKLLHVAAGDGHAAIVNLLLENGADVNKLQGDKSPLMHAVDERIFDILISRGADVNLVTGSNSCFQLVLHYFVSYDFRCYMMNKLNLLENEYLNTKQKMLVQKLIKCGALVDSLDYNGNTPLIIAAKSEYSFPIVKKLLKAGANINHANDDGYTALHMAAEIGVKDTIKYLLKLGTDVNAITKNGRSALFLCDDEDILKVLIENKADVDIQDVDGNTALMYNILQWSFDYEISDLTTLTKFNVNHHNRSGQSPLLLAAKLCQPNLIKSLLSAGADVNYILLKGNKIKSVFTILMKRLLEREDESRECLEVVLEHDPCVRNISPYVIHLLTASGCESLIPKFIALGLGPAELKVQKTVSAWYTSTARISPLGVALMSDNLLLAQYYLDARFLTQGDLSLLHGNKAMEIYFKSKFKDANLEFVDKTARKIFSLETLSFIACSDAIGHGPKRSERIQNSGLPSPLQENLLFSKAASTVLDDSDCSDYFIFQSALRQIRHLKPDDSSFNHSDDDSHSL